MLFRLLSSAMPPASCPASAAPPRIPQPLAVDNDHWVVTHGFIAHAMPAALITAPHFWTCCRLVHEYIGGSIAIERQDGPVGSPTHLSVRFGSTLLGASVRLGATKGKYSGKNAAMRALGERMYLQGIPIRYGSVVHCRGENVLALLNGLHRLIQNELNGPWPAPSPQHALHAREFRTISLPSDVPAPSFTDDPSGPDPAPASSSGQWLVIGVEQVPEDTD